MELKLSPFSAILTPSIGSNCTFMELKYLKQESRNFHGKCSNCTFMELKLGNGHIYRVGFRF